MDRLIFFCAFGREYLQQFDMVYPDLIGWGDILLVTDSDIERAGVNVIKLPGRERPAAFMARVKVHKLVNFAQWENVWYSDTDILFKRNIFERYTTGIHLLQEPKTTMANEHFSGMLNRKQLETAKRLPGINAGLIQVSRKHAEFWKLWDETTVRHFARRPWISEQQALNYIYLNHFNRYPFGFIEGMGWPAKDMGGEYADHFNCLDNKLTWMKSAKK